MFSLSAIPGERSSTSDVVNVIKLLHFVGVVVLRSVVGVIA
jgi:hypothetical protein